MGVTKRLILIACIGAVLVLAAGTGGAGPAVAAFVLVNLVLAGLYLLDWRSTPDTGCIAAERVMEAKLSLGVPNQVELIIRNNSDAVLHVTVTDTVPVHFNHTLPPAAQEIPPHAARVFTYTATPLKRGAFLFPCIYFRYTGVYGICTKQGKRPTEQLYKVYPNMKALTEYRLSALSKNQFMQGIKRGRQAAAGGEFDSLREYREGDPFHVINWNATARRRELIVNQYVPERNQYIYIVLDSSRVMNGEYRFVKKLDYAVNAAFLMTDYCIGGGDHVGLMVFDSRVRRFLAPRKGKAQFEAMAEQLYNVEYTESAADYEEALRFLAQKQRRRALVFIFTELFNADEALRFAEAVKHHLGRHLVYAITIRDPRVDALACRMPRQTEDLYLKSAAVKLQQERRRIGKVLSSAGILNSDAAPDQLSLEAVSRYLEMKRAGML